MSQGRLHEGYGYKSMEMAGGMSAAAETMAILLYYIPAPVSGPKGVDVIQEKIEMDLGKMAAGQPGVLVHGKDQILNPSGYVIIDLKLSNFRQGSYKVKIGANGKTIQEFSLGALIPPKERFSYPESLKHFKVGKGKKQPSSDN